MLTMWYNTRWTAGLILLSYENILLSFILLRTRYSSSNQTFELLSKRKLQNKAEGLVCRTCRTTRRNWEEGGTFWRGILVTNLFVCSSDRHPFRPGVSNISLFAGFFLFIYIGWIYSSISNNRLFLPAFSGQINKLFSADRGFCHDRVHNKLCAKVPIKSRVTPVTTKYSSNECKQPIETIILPWNVLLIFSQMV